MASSTLPSYPIQHDQQQQHLSDYFTYASATAMNIPGASRYTSQQEDKSMTRECLLFPTYAFRNPKDPSEWVIRTRGWALSHNRSGAKRKFVTSISKGVVGQNSGDHAMFEERFKYFLAKNKRNKQFIIQAAGTHALPSDSWHSSPLSSFSSSPSSSSADLFDNNNSNTVRHFTDQPQQRRDSDGSTDSGFQSSGVIDKDDYSYLQGNSNTAALFAMERPANPLSSILSGRRMQSTTSIPSSLSSNNSNDSKQYHGDNDDYDDDYDDEQYDNVENAYNTINDELPSNDHYLTINTTNSDASTTTMSSLFTYPSFASSVTSPTSSSSASASDSVTLKANNDYIDKVDGRAIFKSESSGFFSGPTHLSHRQVLQWAKEKDYCDARLLQIKSTPYSNNKDHHHKGMDPACAETVPFPTSTGMVNLIEPTGISIISDIDDTIKETQILHGARTVLANTFFKESKDISGMAETYMKWYTQGASFHYVSNSPFQLLPFLHDFLNTTQFPPGSMHLRLDGSILARLVEIPGRAKRDSILGIMHDFPLRQFVLVGDSGEIDLEIYTKIAVENPGRILKIFIHDVTTPYAMQKKRAKKSASTTTNDSTDTMSNSNLLRTNSMSLSSLFQTTSSSTLNSKRYSLDIHSQQQQRRPVSLQSASSSPSLLEAAEEISKNKSNSLLELASSMASSSVLGLGRGRTKTFAEFVNEPPSFSSTTTSPATTSGSGSGSGSTSSLSLPPSQQCIQLYDRVEKAQKQLPNIDIVLFQNADELRDDTTIQKALWQQWDDQCLNNTTAPII
ncbi:unnamed protein product [Absidia cylindrospora]